MLPLVEKKHQQKQNDALTTNPVTDKTYDLKQQITRKNQIVFKKLKICQNCKMNKQTNLRETIFRIICIAGLLFHCAVYILNEYVHLFFLLINVSQLI